MQFQRHSSQLYCSISRFLHAEETKTTQASWRAIIYTQMTRLAGAMAALIGARRWLGGSFTFLLRVYAVLFVWRRVFSIAAVSSVIAVAAPSREVSRGQYSAAATIAGRRSVFSHLPRPTSQQQQLHLSRWSLFANVIGVGNVCERRQPQTVRSSPAGLASLSPYLLQRFSSCFLSQVARSLSQHLHRICAEHACTHCSRHLNRRRRHNILLPLVFKNYATFARDCRQCSPFDPPP
jgi:hypothetical protein